MYTVNDLPIRRRTWAKISAIPMAKLGWELSDCKHVEQKVVNALSTWLKHVYAGSVIRAEGKPTCGLGLLVSGAPGRGKTTLACVSAQEILRNISPEAIGLLPQHTLVRPVYFTTFNSLLDLKGSLMGEHDRDDDLLYNGILGESHDDAYNIRVLVLDDVGKEHASLSGWQRNMLHHVLRTRFNNGLPTIITTNLAPDDWEVLYGSATASFINEAFAHVSLLSTQDLRSL